MFTPDNEKLKKIIFHLLKKKFDYDDSQVSWTYNNKRVTICYPFHPYIKKSQDGPEDYYKPDETKWAINISIYNTNNTNNIDHYIAGNNVDLTEKEAMEIKWALDDFYDNQKESYFNELADFALEDNGTQDDLLD